jgi:hypothetical protein
MALLEILWIEFTNLRFVPENRRASGNFDFGSGKLYPHLLFVEIKRAGPYIGIAEDKEEFVGADFQIRPLVGSGHPYPDLKRVAEALRLCTEP